MIKSERCEQRIEPQIQDNFGDDIGPKTVLWCGRVVSSHGKCDEGSASRSSGGGARWLNGVLASPSKGDKFMKSISSTVRDTKT